MTLDDEVAGAVQQPDDRALLGREPDQRLMLDELQVATPGAGTAPLSSSAPSSSGTDGPALRGTP